MNHVDWVWHWMGPQPIIWVKNNQKFNNPKIQNKGEQCWHFVPCITIKEIEDTHVFNRKLVHHGAKIKWETKKMGWSWFPLLNVYGMTPMFLTLVLNFFSVECELFSKACNPPMTSIWKILQLKWIKSIHNILKPTMDLPLQQWLQEWSPKISSFYNIGHSRLTMASILDSRIHNYLKCGHCSQGDSIFWFFYF